MKVITDFLSPNIDSIEIPAEFLILHYTGCDLNKTLEIFLDPATKASSHFIIDTNGDCYDLGNFFNGVIRKGAHAGASSIDFDDKKFSALNDFSIGVELVNLNGNMFSYTNQQYESLKILISHLQSRFLMLNNAKRIVGHEHIAFQRGKVDPGLKFDWQRTLNSVGLIKDKLHDFHGCDASDINFLKNEINQALEIKNNSDFWPKLSTKLEQRIAQRNSML